MVAKYLKVKSIPQLPPHINQLLAFDCPSIKRVMSNSNSTRIDLNLLSDSNETGAFKFHFTNSQEPDVLIVALLPKHGLGSPRLHTSLRSSVFLGVQFLLGSLIVVRDFR